MSSNPTEKLEDIPGIRPYFEVSPEGLTQIGDLLASGNVTNNGAFVREFESMIGSYLNAKEVVVVSTGADALLLGLRALSLPSGKIVLPAYTYIATLNAVVLNGFTPLFCDIEETTLTIDPQSLARLMAAHPDIRGVIAVNAFGVPPDLQAIRKICDLHAVKLAYDNAHGFGTEIDGARLTDEPDIQTFSFHATKTLPAVEGGGVIAREQSVTSLIRRMRNHGLAPVRSETVPGYNAKMDELRALIGIYSLREFPGSLARRRSYGDRMVARFSLFPDVFTVQTVPDAIRTNYQNIGVRCRSTSPDGLSSVIELFAAHGVGVRSYFDPPLYKLPGYENGSELPITEKVWRTLISFPIHSRMSESALCRIEDAITSVGGSLRKRL